MGALRAQSDGEQTEFENEMARLGARLGIGKRERNAAIRQLLYSSVQSLSNLKVRSSCQASRRTLWLTEETRRAACPWFPPGNPLPFRCILSLVFSAKVTPNLGAKTGGHHHLCLPLTCFSPVPVLLCDATWQRGEHEGAEGLLDNYEEAFGRLKEAPGGDGTPGEVVEHFLAKEDANLTLFTCVNELKQEKDRLEEVSPPPPRPHPPTHTHTHTHPTPVLQPAVSCERRICNFLPAMSTCSSLSYCSFPLSLCSS